MVCGVIIICCGVIIILFDVRDNKNTGRRLWREGEVVCMEVEEEELVEEDTAKGSGNCTIFDI